MWRVAVAGLCLVAAAVVWLIGSLIDPAARQGSWLAGSSAVEMRQAIAMNPDRYRIASAACALGACTALAGAAAGYRVVGGAARRAVSAGALALLGVGASAWVVEATLRITYTVGAARRASAGNAGVIDLVGVGPDPLAVVALFASGIGLALLAGAARHAGLLGPAVGWVLAAGPMLGVIAAAPAAPYVLGAGPLGIGLLLGVAQSPHAHSSGRAKRRWRCHQTAGTDDRPPVAPLRISPVALPKERSQ